MLSVSCSRQFPLTSDCLRAGASKGVNESAIAMAAPADSGQCVGIHAASVLPKLSVYGLVSCNAAACVAGISTHMNPSGALFCGDCENGEISDFSFFASVQIACTKPIAAIRQIAMNKGVGTFVIGHHSSGLLQLQAAS